MVPLWLQALVLGVVQGLSEFIPISSSAHLVLVPYLLGWGTPTLAFDVALHMGTLAAVLLYFRRDFVAMVTAVTHRADTPEARLYRRLAWMIVLGTVPVVVIGGVFKESIEEAFTSPTQTAIQLFATAALLIATDKLRTSRVARAQTRVSVGGGESGGDSERVWNGDWIGGDAQRGTWRRLRELPIGYDEHDPAGATLVRLTPARALVVGFMQALALLPGISRAGATIAGGVFSRLTREAATRYAFLLSIPALFGAGRLRITDLDHSGGYAVLDIVVGVIAAFVSGYLAIRWLIALVARERLTGFAWYCMVAGAVGLLGVAMLGPA